MLAALADLDETPAADTLSSLLTTHLRHARRRSEEVDEVCEMLAEAGCPSRMMTAAAATFARSLEARIIVDDPPVDLSQALQRLASAHCR